MAEKVHVLPGEDRLVKLPGRKIVPKEGVICERTEFIERRLACGDLVMPKDQSAVTKAEEAAAKEAATPAKQPAAEIVPAAKGA